MSHDIRTRFRDLSALRC